jgi:voltage-gated potassium channel
MNRPAVAIQTPSEFGKPDGGMRRIIYTIIFEADTRAGLRFDLFLIIAILISILVVILDSVQPVNARYAMLMNALEWGFTL